MDRRMLHESLIAYNRIFRDTEEIYRGIARRFGLSYCSFWILYLLRETDTPYNQSALCQMLLLPRQTVNSALKTLQANGWIVLEQETGNRKNKPLRLTPAGERFAEQTVDRVLAAEENALARFSPAERAQFLRLGRDYAEHLREQSLMLDPAESTCDEG